MNTKAITAPNFVLFRFLTAYVVQMRPYLLFISGAAGAAGIVFQGQDPLLVMIVFLPLFLGYGFGQALTDCFQTDTDAVSAPYRPLSRGVVSKMAVLLVSGAGLCLSALIYLSMNPHSLWLCVLIIFGLATYTYVKRNITWLAPFYNAGVVAMLPMLGYMISAGPVASVPVEVVDVSALSLFSYANFVLVGYLKDIGADRLTGYRTFPVVYGWDATICYAWVIGVLTIAIYIIVMPVGLIANLLGLSGALVLIMGLARASTLRVKNEHTALFPIVSTVRSFILLHLAMVLEHCADLIWPALIYYLCFELTLRRRPSKYQV